MASFRIHNDNENNSHVLRARNKDVPHNQRRTVLGVVNNNADLAKNSKNLALPEKGALKPKVIGKNALGDKGRLPLINGVPQKQKPVCQPFKVFQDEDVSKPATVTLKNDTKVRALRERRNDVAPKALSQKEDVSVCLPLPLPREIAPEPMSPESVDSPMCLDVSIKSDSKRECEAAERELDHLNLTERLYMCDEYRAEISLYLRALQLEHRPRANYMLRQPDITYNMRAVLVDWLVEVVEEYKMTNETLYLAVAYIDRFLSCMSVVRSKLQLVGTAAMFIAAKYEEIYPPDVKDFVYITDDTYSKQQVLRMEHLILRQLHFDLSAPTALTFLADYTAHYPMPEQVKYLAMYLCELSLLQGDPYLAFKPSDVAAAALCVARNLLLPHDDLIPPALHAIMDVQLTDLMLVICALEGTYSSAETNVQQATRDKFKTEKYLKVAMLPAPDKDCSSLLSYDYDSQKDSPHRS